MAAAAPPRSPVEVPYGEKELLHRRCGIYTKPEVVARILDAVGWQESVDLSSSSLLEPSAGDGAFVVEAARRLVRSYRRHGIEPSAASLRGKIKAIELHPREARRARRRVLGALRELGVHKGTATACVRDWISNSDFLLADFAIDKFTHAVGNPPYVRWSKVPPELKAKYARRLPRDLIGGDLFLPFLHLALDYLRPGGHCGFVCSDRWRFMGFAEGFRSRWLPRIDILSEQSLPSTDAFLENVDSYPSILIAAKRAPASAAIVTPLRQSGKSLADLRCVIKVGPALGHTPAFVLRPDEAGVEGRLLKSWIEASEIHEGIIRSTGQRVIVMNRAGGELLDLEEYPLLAARMSSYRSKLEGRAIVKNGAPWYRPIDRVRAKDWARPKILVPEIAKVPRCAVDRTGSIPSHGVYAIFVEDDDIDPIYERLRDGKLARALQGVAPRVKGNYVRCYRRFLEMLRI